MYTPASKYGVMKRTTAAFARFTKVQDHQCLPKPKHLGWEAAAAYMLVSATSYRMLMAWAIYQKDDVVLVWEEPEA